MGKRVYYVSKMMDEWIVNNLNFQDKIEMSKVLQDSMHSTNFFYKEIKKADDEMRNGQNNKLFCWLHAFVCVTDTLHQKTEDVLDFQSMNLSFPFHSFLPFISASFYYFFLILFYAVKKYKRICVQIEWLIPWISTLQSTSSQLGLTLYHEFMTRWMICVPCSLLVCSVQHIHCSSCYSLFIYSSFFFSPCIKKRCIVIDKS